MRTPDGSVFGEGGGIVVLENLENATKRETQKFTANLSAPAKATVLITQYEHLEPDGKD